MKSRVEIRDNIVNILNECNGTSSGANRIVDYVYAAMKEYASQQAPAMYTREQVEKAVEFGFRQCKLQGYISPSQEQQFIQSLK